LFIGRDSAVSYYFHEWKYCGVEATGACGLDKKQQEGKEQRTRNDNSSTKGLAPSCVLVVELGAAKKAARNKVDV
jgi:hypothetical protein